MSNILRPVKSDICHEQRQFLKGRTELMNGTCQGKSSVYWRSLLLTAVAMTQTAEERMHPALGCEKGRRPVTKLCANNPTRMREGISGEKGDRRPEITANLRLVRWSLEQDGKNLEEPCSDIFGYAH